MTMPPALRAVRKKRFAWPWAFAGLVALSLGAAVYCRHLGYPDGPVYRFLPAQSGAMARGDGTVALFFSGDMGFNTGMAPQIAGKIAEQGVPVLGVNSLAAFSRRRTPEDVRALVENAARRALALAGARRVALIGQSFGANILLEGVRHLPPDLRAHIGLVALVVPGDRMLFRATPGGLFDFSDDGPALAVARHIGWTRVLCIHGQEESHSLCPQWRQSNVRSLALPGGHFLNEDIPLISATLSRAIAEQGAALSVSSSKAVPK